MLKMKRGQIPEAIVIVMVVVIAGYSLYQIYSFNANIKDKVAMPSELSDIYSGQDRFKIFAENAAELSVQQAFSDVSKNVGDSISNNKINENFVNAIDLNFKKMINSSQKYKITLGNDLGFEFESQTTNFSGNGYNGTYRYAINFSIENLMKEDFESLFKKLSSRKDLCSGENLSGSDLTNCMDKLTLDDWAVNCIPSDKTLKCSLKSKRNYFHDGSFSKIETKLTLDI